MIQTPNPFNFLTVVSPDDTDDLPFYKSRGKLLTEAIYVGVAGDVSVALADGSTYVLTAVSAGTFLPLAVRRINASNTTADKLLACYVG